MYANLNNFEQMAKNRDRVIAISKVLKSIEKSKETRFIFHQLARKRSKLIFDFIFGVESMKC
jgi:hypothetical protein